jgi:RsiW-degrading membrane proteinase PrsW (M82 family)
MVFLLVRGTRYRYELDGVILGAAAGMGFAAFEDAGYAIAALNQHGIPDFLSTLWLRQVLGPFGHGTWTASIAAVIFRHRAEGQKPRWGHVWIAYFVSSLLHALWDWNPLAGLGSFIWMVVIGGISIIRLRGLVIESIKEERALGGGQLATS